jgi:glycosyltransferase involved in cell wall biosynthesis
MCKLKGIGFVGEVHGTKKAELLAGAKALIFPTTLNEPFGLVIAEALISGTPVISSSNGACSELLTDEVGFICKCRADYVNAVERIGDISSKACRDKAMRDFHYLRMAGDYVAEYRKEIAANEAK